MDHSTPTPDLAATLELGSALGQSHAFGLVAGRCSAAQASCLHCIRATPAYLHQGLPICVTTGRTIEETRRLIAEAVEAQAA